MNGYSIGISGLNVAQAMIDMIGTNIANAATDGYHRQELKITPVESDSAGSNMVTAGPVVQGIRRMIDSLLEQEIVRQQPIAGQNDKELETLQTIESVLGQVDSNGLGSALGSFFNSLTTLTTRPDNAGLREQTVWTADSLAGQFHNIAGLLSDIRSRVYSEAQTMIDRVNKLGSEIAHLNSEIQLVEIKAGNANPLRDQRDQSIKELAKLVDVKIEIADPRLDLVNVISGGTPLVLNGTSTPLEVDYVDGQDIGVSVAGAHYYSSDLPGGQLGGLLSVANKILPKLSDSLDLLARQVIDRVNELQVQGVGTAGSFTTLTGERLGNGTLENWNADIQPGSFYIRITDAAGNETVHEVAVDPSTDTAAAIRDRINTLAPTALAADLVDSSLQLRALNGAKFDFIPTVTVDAGGLGGPDPAQPSVSGTYSGQDSDTFTCTVGGSGQVGVTDGLTVEVRNSAGDLVGALNVGSGYAAGDPLELGSGLRMAISSGTLNDGESFSLTARAESDETGFLAAAGLNTFFSGNSAATIAVRDEMKADSGRLATSRGTDGSDNENIRRLAALTQAALPALDGMTMDEFHRRIVLSVGQDVSVRQARQVSMDKIAQQLANQRDTISGVDINEEAAKMLSSQNLFQAMSRFIGIQNKSIEYLMSLL